MKNRSYCFRSQKAAFTLVELMVVFVIMVVMIGLSLPMFQSMSRSSHLTQASEMLYGSFQEARQLSMTSNRRIEFRLYRSFLKENKSEGYDAFQYFIIDSRAEKSVPRIKKTFFPESIVIHPSTVFSTAFDYLGSQSGYIEKGSDVKEGDYVSFTWMPNGSVFLGTVDPGGISPYLTLVPKSDLAKDANRLKQFVTLQIDPFTGRIQNYR